MHQYQILYWRDIPAQVRVFDGRKPVSRTMPAHFQLEIDRVAMAEGLEGSDVYLDQWHWTERLEREGEEGGGGSIFPSRLGSLNITFEIQDSTRNH